MVQAVNGTVRKESSRGLFLCENENSVFFIENATVNEYTINCRFFMESYVNTLSL